jgi:hypothetical protein
MEKFLHFKYMPILFKKINEMLMGTNGLREAVSWQLLAFSLPLCYDIIKKLIFFIRIYLIHLRTRSMLIANS